MKPAKHTVTYEELVKKTGRPLKLLYVPGTLVRVKGQSRVLTVVRSPYENIDQQLLEEAWWSVNQEVDVIWFDDVGVLHNASIDPVLVERA